MATTLFKTVLASLAVGTMVYAQDGGDVKKISAQDLPKANDWSTITESGWKGQAATAQYWKKHKKVNVLQVIVSDSSKWEKMPEKKGYSSLNYGIVYKDEKGGVYYASGLTAEKETYPNHAWTDTVTNVGGELKPEYQVEGFALGQTVDPASLQTINKANLPKNSDWASTGEMEEGGYAIGCILSAWKNRGVDALGVISSANKWEYLRNSEGKEGSLKAIKYDLVYRENGMVYYAKDLTAAGLEDYARFLYPDVGYAPLTPTAVVPDYILTAAQLDTMKTMSMENLPSIDSIPDGTASAYRNAYKYARYNINDDVIQIYPKTSEWVKVKGTEVLNFDMIHKGADGKVFFTYGYTVSRADAENFEKAKPWKKKMHEVEVSDWNEDTWKKMVKSRDVVLVCAKRQYKTKAELPKEGMKDAATIKQLTKMAKTRYPGFKKLIIRNTAPEVNKDYLNRPTKRLIVFDVIFERKTNAGKKVYVIETLPAEQVYNGKSFDKNWSNKGYSDWNDRGPFDERDIMITDWK